MRGKTQVPEGWRIVPLGEVGRFINGRAFKPSDWTEAGLPIVRIQNLTNEHAPFNRHDGPVNDDNFIDTGDIVISWSASIEARTWSRGPALLNQHLFKAVERSNVIHNRFLFFLLEGTTNELRRRVHGTTMQHVTKGTFDSTRVLLPPLPEQRAIAAVLDSIDDAIESTEAVIAATERLRDSLLHELLTRGVPGRHTEWKEAPGIGTIPACWDVVQLGKVAEVNPRRPQLNIADDTWTKFLPMTAVGKHISGVIESENRPYGEVSSGYTYFEEYDVIFAKITPCLQNGKHALVRNLPNGFGFGSTEFHVVRAGEFLDPRHLFRALTQPRNIRECVNSFTGTAGQQRVQPDVLKSLPILLPPLPEQQAIAAMLDGVDDAIGRVREERDGLQTLKASAADALLTGRVRVSEDEISSPGTPIDSRYAAP